LSPQRESAYLPLIYTNILNDYPPNISAAAEP